MTRTIPHFVARFAQSGAAAVELAILMVFAFLPLLLGILEVSRLFYVATTAQEVTRRAAREQVVRWTSQTGNIQRMAVFQGPGNGTVTLPGGREVANTSVRLTFHNSYADANNPSSTGITGVSSPQANLNTCLINASDPNCIQFVRARLANANGDPLLYAPMIGMFSSVLSVPLPGSTVIMPAEALGLL